MKKIVHLSDLHFGRADLAMAATLAKAVRDMKPDIIAVSGDLTQRAKREEFKAARAFIDELPAPRIVVPGNHDISAHFEPWHRFFMPFRRWRKYISSDLEPSFVDPEIAVFGVNTAHQWTVKGGRITPFQAARLKKELGEAPPSALKIVVAHHPFDLPSGHSHAPVKGGAMLFEALAESGLDIILAGHVHEYHVGHSADRYEVAHCSVLLIHAGTAISDRLRRETNSFNVILADQEHVTVIPHLWEYDEHRYVPASPERFVRGGTGWEPGQNP